MSEHIFAKWMLCTVPGEQRERFSTAQAQWQDLAACPGLIAQFGGWDLAHEGPEELACVLALWQDAWAYQEFMNTAHDQIVAQNDQAQTYAQLQVRFWHDRLQFGPQSLQSSLAKAQMLRVADCLVTPSRQSHFEQVQAEVWAPGMAAAGMLSGQFWQETRRRSPADNAYLVTSLWPDEATHSAYLHEAFPDLSARAQPQQDLEQIRGHRVALEPAWSVRG